jgi:tripartite-type tricarboxylate transporter receptor subunit TctC
MDHGASRMARRSLIGAAALVAAPRAVRAQTDFPVRPLRWVVNFPPGGAADFLSRSVAERLAPRLTQPVAVENRPGAGGMIGADFVAKARGDGHVLVASNLASHAISPAIYASVPYDPVADFTHLALMGTLPQVLAVNTGFPGTTVEQFIAEAKRRPGGIEYGSGGNGTSNHFLGVMLARAARIQLVHVPYRGSAPALVDTISGKIPAIFESLPTALGHIRAGRLRAIAVSSRARADALPDVLTFAERGLPEIEAVGWFGVSAPAGLPPGVAGRLATALGAVLGLPDIRARFAEAGVEAGSMWLAEYANFVRAEAARWKALAAAHKISVE